MQHEGNDFPKDRRITGFGLAVLTICLRKSLLICSTLGQNHHHHHQQKPILYSIWHVSCTSTNKPTLASLPVASLKPCFGIRVTRILSFHRNPLLDGLRDLLVKRSLFSEVPVGNSSVRRESPRMELFGNEPCIGAESLTLVDNCCSTLNSRAGSLLKWVVAYRSVKETGWDMNLSFNSFMSHFHPYPTWSPKVIITSP